MSKCDEASARNATAMAAIQRSGVEEKEKIEGRRESENADEMQW
jgi:hypothetical protein